MRRGWSGAFRLEGERAADRAEGDDAVLRGAHKKLAATNRGVNEKGGPRRSRPACMQIRVYATLINEGLEWEVIWVG